MSNNMNVAARAAGVARIFDILAWIVLVVFGLATGIGLLAAIVVLFSEGFAEFLFVLLYAVGAAVYGALTWASVSLATVVAGYIAQKSE